MQSVSRRAGGKGVNVARTLHALGHEVMVTGLAGGTTGTEARDELAASGLQDRTVAVAGTSRTTLMIVEPTVPPRASRSPGRRSRARSGLSC